MAIISQLLVDYLCTSYASFHCLPHWLSTQKSSLFCIDFSEWSKRSPLARYKIHFLSALSVNTFYRGALKIWFYWLRKYDKVTILASTYHALDTGTHARNNTPKLGSIVHRFTKLACPVSYWFERRIYVYAGLRSCLFPNDNEITRRLIVWQIKRAQISLNTPTKLNWLGMA